MPSECRSGGEDISYREVLLWDGYGFDSHKRKSPTSQLADDLQSPTFKRAFYKSLRAAYVIKKTHKLPILYHVIGELSMLKLYEKSHIKHLPGYGRVWYGFCLDVKGFNEAQPEFFVGFDHVI